MIIMGEIWKVNGAWSRWIRNFNQKTMQRTVREASLCILELLLQQHQFLSCVCVRDIV